MNITTRSQELSIWMPFDRNNFKAVTLQLWCVFFCVSIINPNTWIFTTFTCGNPPRTRRHCYTANSTLNQTFNPISLKIQKKLYFRAYYLIMTILIIINTTGVTVSIFWLDLWAINKTNLCMNLWQVHEIGCFLDCDKSARAPSNSPITWWYPAGSIHSYTTCMK